MSREKPDILENRRTVTATMLDTTAMSRTQMMNMIEQELLRSVLNAAAQRGVVVDVPAITWTCVVTGREKFAEDGAGGRGQVSP